MGEEEGHCRPGQAWCLRGREAPRLPVLKSAPKLLATQWGMVVAEGDLLAPCPPTPQPLLEGPGLLPVAKSCGL